jgi:hypothetical protein
LRIVITKITGHRTRSVFNRYNITDHSDTLEAGRKAEEFLAREREIGKRPVKTALLVAKQSAIGCRDPKSTRGEVRAISSSGQEKGRVNQDPD